MQTKKHPKWIDEFGVSGYQIQKGTVLEGFQPIDFYHFFPLWYDLFISQIARAVDELKHQGKTLKETVPHFTTPSNIRALFQKTIPTFPHLQHKNISEFKKVLTFLIGILKLQCKTDALGMRSNIIHTKVELKNAMRKVKWGKADPVVARNVGRLIMGLGHLVNGLYNDLVTDMGWDVYGPYDVSFKFGKGATLLIRDYPNMKPVELWSHAKRYRYRRVRIWTVYRNISCEIKFVGCHTVTKGGSLPDAMIAYGVDVDGKWHNSAGAVRKLAGYFLNEAKLQGHRVDAMSVDARKEKVFLQECYQLRRLLEWLGLDWRPTKEMRARIKKPMRKDLYPMGKLVTFSEFKKYFGVNYLKKNW